MRRYANRKDTIHGDVVLVLSRLGVWFTDIDLSTGIDLLCGDGIVGFFTLEIKSKGGKETERQLRWAARCKAFNCPHLVHREGDDLAEAIGLLRRQRMTGRS